MINRISTISYSEIRCKEKKSSETTTAKTLEELCVPRHSIFDPSRLDTVLDLTSLVEDRIDPESFFNENYVTEGMKVLLTEGFRRL